VGGVDRARALERDYIYVCSQLGFSGLRAGLDLPRRLSYNERLCYSIYRGGYVGMTASINQY